MKTDVSITGSKNIPGNITGVTITYGVNMIPYALVTVDVSLNTYLAICDYKKNPIRTPAWIKVQTKEGCLRFDGLIDGLSFSQSPGAMNPSIVIKSNFQQLYELYPRLPGFHPSAEHVFKRTSVLSYDLTDDAGYFRGLGLNKDYGGPEAGGGNFGQATADKNVFQYIVELMTVIVNAQSNLQELFSSAYTDVEPRIFQLLEPLLEDKRAAILDLLSRIDTSAVNGMKIKASGIVGAEMIVTQLLNAKSSLMDFLASVMSNLGCSMVIANEKMYIVPETGYLKVDHATPNIKEVSELINVIYPAQYDNITFNDNGYKDILGCLIVANHSSKTSNLAFTDLGAYLNTDPNAKGGIITVQFPDMLSGGLAELPVLSQGDIHKVISGGQSITVATPVDMNDEVASDDASRQKEAESANVVRDYLDDIAQMKYLQAKYQDRTGSISSLLNFDWVPGVVGTAYCRRPGTFIDFLVTGVTHRIEKSPGATCVARTNINFNCGRINEQAVGLDKIRLYDYGLAEMNRFKSAFVTDIGKQ